MWYFKGRRKKYKSPYTGKEVDAAVGKGGKLPTVTVADAGKILGIDENGNYVAVDLNALPAVSALDEGKILQVNSNGEWEVKSYPINESEGTIYSDTIEITQTMIDNYQWPSLMDTSLASADFTSASLWDVKLNGINATWTDLGRGEYSFNVEEGDERFGLYYTMYDSELEVLAVTATTAGNVTILIEGNTKEIDENFVEAVSEVSGFEPFQKTGNPFEFYALDGSGNWVEASMITIPTPSPTNDTLFAPMYIQNGGAKQYIKLMESLSSIPNNTRWLYAIEIYKNSAGMYTFDNKQIPNIPVLTIGAGSGTYVLKGTVTNNNVTFEWVRES